jgi:hypothetical protein
MAQRKRRSAAAASLYAWRTRRRLSQLEAAKQIRASQAAWAAWELGTKAPDLHYAFAIEVLTRRQVLAKDWARPRVTTHSSIDPERPLKAS